LFLEFECEVDNITINGIDMMTLDENGNITEFKVMVRPMKAMMMIREKMAKELEKMNS
jgi:hypothetical protein